MNAVILYVKKIPKSFVIFVIILFCLLIGAIAHKSYEYYFDKDEGCTISYSEDVSDLKNEDDNQSEELFIKDTSDLEKEDSSDEEAEAATIPEEMQIRLQFVSDSEMLIRVAAQTIDEPFRGLVIPIKLPKEYVYYSDISAYTFALINSAPDQMTLNAFLDCMSSLQGDCGIKGVSSMAVSVFLNKEEISLEKYVVENFRSGNQLNEYWAEYFEMGNEITALVNRDPSEYFFDYYYFSVKDFVVEVRCDFSDSQCDDIVNSMSGYEFYGYEKYGEYMLGN